MKDMKRILSVALFGMKHYPSCTRELGGKLGTRLDKPPRNKAVSVA